METSESLQFDQSDDGLGDINCDGLGDINCDGLGDINCDGLDDIDFDGLGDINFVAFESNDILDWNIPIEELITTQEHSTPTLVAKRSESLATECPATATVSNQMDGFYLCMEDPDICCRTYKKMKELNLHIKQFHKNRNHVCDKEGCAQKFLSEVKLRQHKIKDHGEKLFPCLEDVAICTRQYSSQKQLTSHIKQFHKGRTFHCDYEGCSEKFLSELMLIGHKTKAHNFVKVTKERRIVCEICGVPVTRLSQHFRTYHLGQDSFSCEQCTMTLDTPEELQNHEQLHSNISEKFPFACVIPECEKIWGSSMALKNHVKICHLKSWLNCPICHVKKPNEFLLKRHVKLQHEREKTVKFCDQCPKSFNCEQHLQTHKRNYHLGIKFVCQICSQDFTVKRSLERHMRTHLGVKPFKCKVCPKAFTDNDGLKRHEEIHSGKNNYECQLCGKWFKQVQSLRLHLKKQDHG